MLTTADVAAWGAFEEPTGPVLVQLERTLAAAVERLEAHYYYDDPMTATQELAVLMQTARWWKRRQTPEGRSAFGGDIAVSITEFDPDVHAMLTPREGLA